MSEPTLEEIVAHWERTKVGQSANIRALIASWRERGEAGERQYEQNVIQIAHIAKLEAALTVLLEEAEGFNVSGVYFDEPCMGHKGPALARAALKDKP